MERAVLDPYDQLTTEQKVDWLVANMSIREIAAALVQEQLDCDLIRSRLYKLQAADLYQVHLRG